MKYRFPSSLEVDYSPLKQFLREGEELSKNSILDRCSGNVPFELMQSLKELEFNKIGKEKGELYLM